MISTHISSSTIETIGFQLGKLFVKFHSGGVYSYTSVPFAYYIGLRDAVSAGQYLHRYIKKGGYRYSKLDRDPFSA